MSGVLQDWVWVPAASTIAREAGAVLREFFSKGVETEYKGDVDLVTVANRTAEKLIRERLAEAFPDHGIYGEEGTRDRLDGEFRWYVDPLDGTTNFAHGYPQFCVSLGLEDRTEGVAPGQDGRLVAGVVYDPLRDELFCAERGRGACFSNGTTLVPSISVNLVGAAGTFRTGLVINSTTSINYTLTSSGSILGYRIDIFPI